MTSLKSIYLIVTLSTLIELAIGQNNIPGAQTASGVISSSVDGMSRYLAPNGPIQPAITAIGGLPMRGVELVNSGISQISSGLSSGARGISRAGGNGGDIRMPGLQALESSMPSSIANIGGMMQSAIRQKNSFIMGQAEKGVQAGERLRDAMQSGIMKKSNILRSSAGMMGGMQDSMMKGGSNIKNHLKSSLEGHMDRLQSMQGIGQNMGNQMQGISRTLSNGLSGTMSQLHQTGEQVMSQIKNGLQQNSGAMSGIMGSMHNSMNSLGQNMGKSLQGAVSKAQNLASQVTNQIQQAAQGSMNMMHSMGNKLMKGGASSGGSY